MTRVRVLATGVVAAATLATCTRESGAPATAPAPSSAPVASEAPPRTDAAVETLQGCDSECTGGAGEALRDALHERAATARDCYERALEHSPTAQGRLVVLVRLASDGSVCSYEVLERTIDAGAEFDRCVNERFSASFPPPDGGCLGVAIPMSFVPKEGDGGTSGEREPD